MISTLAHASAALNSSDEFERVRRLLDDAAGSPSPPTPPALETQTPPPSPPPSNGERWLTVPVALALGALIIVVFALLGWCLARTRARASTRTRRGDAASSYWFDAAPPAAALGGVPHLSARAVPGLPAGAGAPRFLRLAPA